VKSFNISLENPTTLRQLLFKIKEELIRERPEMFLSGSSVRPGVLVVINDTDWELCGKEEYQVQDGDHISFISTLHGG
jgi:ubiquitin related modifier 1